MGIYEKIRVYIDLNGINQSSVAEKSGISDTEFDDILNGKKPLYADDFRAICLALNVSPEIFIEVNNK